HGDLLRLRRLIRWFWHRWPVLDSLQEGRGEFFCLLAAKYLAWPDRHIHEADIGTVVVHHGRDDLPLGICEDQSRRFEVVMMGGGQFKTSASSKRHCYAPLISDCGENLYGEGCDSDAIPFLLICGVGCRQSLTVPSARRKAVRQRCARGPSPVAPSG